VLYQLLKPIAHIALTWYYRSVSVAGRSRVPVAGPVFFAVNHSNALVDALVVATALPRDVRFLAKATIFSNPVANAFLHTVGVIPLRRAADETKQHAPGSETGMASATVNEAAPISKMSFADGNEIATTIDSSRNADSFRAVSEALAEGSAVVIFPEGKSHDEPQLAPLRTGLARMALQARESFGVRHIQIIPVGLLFERKEEPRSRVLVQVGDAIDVDAFVAAIADSTHAVEALTMLVTQRLSAVTLNFETNSDAERISVVSETLAALLEPSASVANEAPSLSTVLALVRRTARVRESLMRNGADSELATHVTLYEQRINEFRARLVRENIVVSDIAIDVDATPGVRFAIRELIRAAVVLPVSWWGRATHFIPIHIARALALRNVKALDEPAMNTLIFGVLLVLLSYAIETAIVWQIFSGWWALAFFLTLIPSASSDLRYGDVARRRSERMRAYFKFRRNPQLQRELLAEADWLRRAAGAIEQLA
jgi:glycerol-3-phosphate O-acyltransferase/dihydroxyacetone phosphate acyltransferase